MTSLTETIRIACQPIAGRALALLLAAALAGLAAPAPAQEAGALVIDVDGATTPEVAPFDELPTGASLDLGAATQITLSHYAGCEEVTLKGGKIKILPDEIGYSGSTVLSAVETDCPEPVKMHKSDLIGAVVVLRAAKTRPEASPTPTFLIAVDSSEYDRFSIQLGSKVLVSRPLDGPRISWSPVDAPLAPGEYTVVLSGEGQRMHAAQIKVTPGGPGTIVLRP